MAAKQEKIEQAHYKLQKEHNEQMITDKIRHTRADTELKEEKVYQMMEKKLAQIEEEYTKKAEESALEMRKELGQSMDRKIDRISGLVAQQVTSRLVEFSISIWPQ